MKKRHPMDWTPVSNPVKIINKPSLLDGNLKDRVMKINTKSDTQPKIDLKRVMASAGRLMSFAKSVVPPKRKTQMLI
jgi:hypothetical protein